MENILEKLNQIFRENNDIKKDYYYIFVKRGIREIIWSHHIKTRLPVQGKTLINSVHDKSQYMLIYMVETKMDTIDILNVRAYIVSLGIIDGVDKTSDYPDLIEKIKTYITKAQI